MSLNRRIILSASLVLVVFITLTAATLERAFIDSSESALRDTLTSQLYALMAAAEVENNTVTMPSEELDALLGLPGSGIYGYITNKTGKILWQSSSALGEKPPQPVSLPSADKQFKKISVDNDAYYTFAYGVDWSSETGSIALTFNIITDLKSFNKQISQYRNTLWGWLIAMAALLLISQALILRWGLSPLRKVGVELNRIEIGEQEKIQQHYPQEIEQLTSNINVLLQQERDQKTRYRNALGDLAHSLKTPLAVLQSSLNSNKQDDTLLEQITRMNSIVEYQLQRAATAGSASIGKSINVDSVTGRLLESLYKVYRDKHISVTVEIDKSVIFKGDEGDLMEVLGNLLDNAFKWANQHIEIKAKQKNKQLCITVSDDGPGIAEDKADELLKRGKRADQTTAGHGIGLSIVQNIVEAYHGNLNIIKNQSGGAEITVIL
ncbi:MAG: GHKL domain-containing protein [Gammaproteobacteria bacterium]|nr:GHKL domain-containing protein [Gammaproteobacteria bacterium]